MLPLYCSLVFKCRNPLSYRQGQDANEFGCDTNDDSFPISSFEIYVVSPALLQPISEMSRIITQKMSSTYILPSMSVGKNFNQDNEMRRWFFLPACFFLPSLDACAAAEGRSTAVTEVRARACSGVRVAMKQRRMMAGHN